MVPSCWDGMKTVPYNLSFSSGEGPRSAGEVNIGKLATASRFWDVMATVPYNLSFSSGEGPRSGGEVNIGKLATASRFWDGMKTVHYNLSLSSGEGPRSGGEVNIGKLATVSVLRTHGNRPYTNWASFGTALQPSPINLSPSALQPHPQSPRRVTHY